MHEHIEVLREKLTAYKSAGKSMFCTSSFQTHSTVLLHLISKVDATIPIYFVNTGYHFPETLDYRDLIIERFGLNLKEVFSATPRSKQRAANGSLMFAVDPDYCCYMNKTQPLEPVLGQHDVWLNGVRADQNDHRKQFKEVEQAAFNCLRFHPMLNWTNKDIWRYISNNDIPHHPLEAQGYLNIGCEPCTRKFDYLIDSTDRSGRWFGLKKSECGINTDLMP